MGKNSGNYRPSRPRKRKFSMNQHTAEQETSFASAKAEKIKDEDYEDIEINHLKCKECDGDVKFTHTAPRGLGFKLNITCECKSEQVNSSPLVNTAFEINRRIMFAMRLLGLGLNGVNVFCSLMDLTSGYSFSKKMYYSFLENLHCAAKSTFEVVQQKALKEEIETNTEPDSDKSHLTVSGDGFWKKKGLSSLFGVATLVGKFSNKILDLEVKSAMCAECNEWEHAKDSSEYKSWFATHEKHCVANQSKAAEKMEVDAVSVMFDRSEKSLGVQYTNYISKKDPKLFQKMLEKKPYNVTVQKEDSGLVQVSKERFNSCVWKSTPRHCGQKTVEAAAFVAAMIFNEGYSSVLKMMNVLGIVVGIQCKHFIERIDEEHEEETKMTDLEKKIRNNQRRISLEKMDFYEEEESLMYGPGLAV